MHENDGNTSKEDTVLGICFGNWRVGSLYSCQTNEDEILSLRAMVELKHSALASRQHAS